MEMARLRNIARAAALFSLLPTVLPQNSADDLRVRISVNLVQIDAKVTDSRGAPDQRLDAGAWHG